MAYALGVGSTEWKQEEKRKQQGFNVDSDKCSPHGRLGRYKEERGGVPSACQVASIWAPARVGTVQLHSSPFPTSASHAGCQLLTASIQTPCKGFPAGLSLSRGPWGSPQPMDGKDCNMRTLRLLAAWQWGTSLIGSQGVPGGRSLSFLLG